MSEHDESIICSDDVCARLPSKEKLLSSSRIEGNTVNPKTKKKITPPSIIKNAHTQHELDRILTQGVPIIVEFVTTWCGACKNIAPLYEELAMMHNETVQSLRIVCDKNKETKKLAAAYGIKSYPVFLLYDEGGNAIGRWDGADAGKLEKAFENLTGGRKKKGRSRR